MTEMDTLTIVRRRLADGRTIADSDVRKLVAQIDQLKAELSEAVERGNDWCDQAKKARAQRDELQDSFDMRWKADMRAIKKWQAANQGNDLVWPDHVDLVVWLMAERDGANALIDRMHAQDVLAIQAWQKANPGNDLQWPGNIRLSAWCLGEIANLEAERDRMREALSRLIGAVDLANASLARGEGEQWIHSQLAPAAGAARASLDPAPLFGRWPGDESDEEIERLLKDF